MYEPSTYEHLLQYGYSMHNPTRYSICTAAARMHTTPVPVLVVVGTVDTIMATNIIL